MENRVRKTIEIHQLSQPKITLKIAPLLGLARKTVFGIHQLSHPEIILKIARLPGLKHFQITVLYSCAGSLPRVRILRENRTLGEVHRGKQSSDWPAKAVDRAPYLKTACGFDSRSLSVLSFSTRTRSGSSRLAQGNMQNVQTHLESRSRRKSIEYQRRSRLIL